MAKEEETCSRQLRKFGCQSADHHSYLTDIITVSGLEITINVMSFWKERQMTVSQSGRQETASKQAITDVMWWGEDANFIENQKLKKVYTNVNNLNDEPNERTTLQSIVILYCIVSICIIM